MSNRVSTPSDNQSALDQRKGQSRPAIRRFAPLLVIVVLAGLAYGLGLHRQVSFETLVRHHAAIDRFVAGNLAAAVAGYIALYIAVVGLSLPGAAIMSFT